MFFIKSPTVSAGADLWMLSCNVLAGEDEGSDHCELDPSSTDEQLSPVEKLEKFIDCEHSYSRYAATEHGIEWFKCCRNLQVVIRWLMSSAREHCRVLPYSKLSLQYRNSVLFRLVKWVWKIFVQHVMEPNLWFMWHTVEESLVRTRSWGSIQCRGSESTKTWLVWLWLKGDLTMKYCAARQMVLHSLHEVIEQVIDTDGDIARALCAVERFSYDPG